MHLTVNDVGDGLFMEIYEDKHLLVTDFGSQQSISHKQLSYFSRRLQTHGNTDFALSHFHKDHYSGLVALEKIRISTDLSTIIIPRLPEDQPVIALFFALQAINRFSLGANSGSMDFDFLSLIGRLNQSGFQLKPLSQGDKFNINGKEFKVSWPPRHFTADILVKVSQAVREFESQVKNIEPLWELYQQMRQYQSIEIYFEGGNQEIYIQKKGGDSGSKTVKPRLSRQQKVILARINRKLKAAANRLSLCYFNDKINFMGDLEATEIKQCLDFIRKFQPDLEWPVVVLPHHGTHWHPDMHNISGQIGVSSAGKKMIRHWANGNKDMCSVNYTTFVDGNFNHSF